MGRNKKKKSKEQPRCPECGGFGTSDGSVCSRCDSSDTAVSQEKPQVDTVITVNPKNADISPMAEWIEELNDSHRLSRTNLAVLVSQALLALKDDIGLKNNELVRSGRLMNEVITALGTDRLSVSPYDYWKQIMRYHWSEDQLAFIEACRDPANKNVVAYVLSDVGRPKFS